MESPATEAVSVIIMAPSMADISSYYLPQLCAHIEECIGVDSYEVLVCCTAEGGDEVFAQESTSRRTVLSFPSKGRNIVSSVNRMLGYASGQMVAFFCKDVLPNVNFFDEAKRVLSSSDQVMGVSCALFSTTGGSLFQGQKRLVCTGGRISFLSVGPVRRARLRTALLGQSNMVFSRQRLCASGAFLSLFKDWRTSVEEFCLRSIRKGGVLVYSPLASCKSIARAASAVPTASSSSTTSAASAEGSTQGLGVGLATPAAELDPAFSSEAGFARCCVRMPMQDRFILEYLHTSGWSHLLFWLKMAFKMAVMVFTKGGEGLHCARSIAREFSEARLTRSSISASASLSLDDVAALDLSLPLVDGQVAGSFSEPAARSSAKG